MRKLLLSALFLFTAFASVFGQNRQISGKVVSADDNQPLPGVSVTVKGSNSGNQTSNDGTFIISVPRGNQTLSFSYIGFLSQDIAIGNRTVVNVKLKSDSRQLGEVVVVGYGSQAKKEVSSAQSTVKAADFANAPLLSPEQALQGRAAGVQITQASGTPGGGMSVRVRGPSSINGSSQPLYVVDGVPINTGSYTQLAAGGQLTNALSDINPNDIESMEVLKDGAAAAIYGSRASNGVVLITTKRGKNQATDISFDSYYGVQNVYKKLETLTGPQYVAYLNEARNNRVGSTGNAGAAFYGYTQAFDSYPNTNWQDQIFRSAGIGSYQLSATGGNENTQFRVSGNYFDQKGIVIGSRYQRYNGRLNLDNQVNKRFKIGLSSSFSNAVSNRLNNDNNIYGAVTGAILLTSAIPVYNANGTFARDPNSSVDNPVASATLTTFNAVNNRLLANTYGEYKILDWLTARTTFGIDYLFTKDRRFYPSTTNAGAGSNGAGIEAQTQDINFVNENTLTARKTFGDHSLTALIGLNYQTSKQENLIASATGFPGNDIRRLSAGSVKTDASSGGTSWGLVSYLSRVNYSFKSKYILQGSVRIDGSSRFGANNRYATFPAASAAWRISQENFLKESRVISELKIRGSYGITGSQEIGNFTSLPLVTGGTNYLQQPGLSPSQLGNPDLSWERNQAGDIGLDVGFLKDRITLTADVYNRTTKDLLLGRPLVGSSGFLTIQKNIGSVRNRGFEIGLSGTPVRTDDILWNVGFNISYNRNKILALSGAPFAQGFASWVQVDQGLGAFRGYRAVGIFQSAQEIASSPVQAVTSSPLTSTQPGDIRFADLDGDGRITANDQEIIGSGLPTYYGGFNTTLEFKRFDLGAFFQFSGGNKIYNNTRSFGENMSGVFGQFATVLNRWTPQNTAGTLPRAVIGDPNTNARVSDRFLEDGDYLRLKNVTLGYTFNKNMLSKVFIKSLRIYAAAQNLVTFTKYSGFDPEVSTFSDTNTSPSTDFGTYPQARNFTFGVNLKF